MNSTSPTTSGSAAASLVARRGLMLVLSSPSGAGKTTLSRRLLAADPDIRLSVSVTTRKPRPGEVDGRDYVFTDVAGFERMRDGGKLLEWARVFDNYYGTPKARIADELAASRDVLFDIDWQGAAQLAAKMPADIVRVFILPPDAQTLHRRLVGRAEDAPEVVARRLAGAAVEIAAWKDYDYIIVNDRLDEAFATLSGILAAERARRGRQTGMAGFVAGLVAACGTLPV